MKYTRVIIDLRSILNESGTEAGEFEYIDVKIDIPSAFLGGYGFDYGFDYGVGL